MGSDKGKKGRREGKREKEGRREEETEKEVDRKNKRDKERQREYPAKFKELKAKFIFYIKGPQSLGHRLVHVHEIIQVIFLDY